MCFFGKQAELDPMTLQRASGHHAAPTHTTPSLVRAGGAELSQRDAKIKIANNMCDIHHDMNSLHTPTTCDICTQGTHQQQ